jgi:hypothetical protein
MKNISEKKCRLFFPRKKRTLLKHQNLPLTLFYLQLLIKISKLSLLANLNFVVEMMPIGEVEFQRPKVIFLIGLLPS